MILEGTPRWYKQFVAITLAHFLVTVFSGATAAGVGMGLSEHPHPSTVALCTQKLLYATCITLGFPILAVFRDGPVLLPAFFNSMLWAGCLAAIVHRRRKSISQPPDGQLSS